MTDRISFASTSVKGPQAIKAQLRNLWEGCVDMDDAMAMVGATDHPRYEEFEDYWRSLED